MEEKTSLKYRIDFNQNISDEDSIMFSEKLSQELLNEKALFFDQWGINFCEGLLDIKAYTQERRSEDIFIEL